MARQDNRLIVAAALAGALGLAPLATAAAQASDPTAAPESAPPEQAQPQQSPPPEPSSGEQAAPQSEAAPPPEEVPPAGHPEVVARVYNGHNYCTYEAGWRGPGWYICGAQLRHGYGWGGYWGWRGWYVPVHYRHYVSHHRNQRPHYPAHRNPSNGSGRRPSQLPSNPGGRPGAGRPPQGGSGGRPSQRPSRPGGRPSGGAGRPSGGGGRPSGGGGGRSAGGGRGGGGGAVRTR